MNKKAEKYLVDILNSIELIEQFVPEKYSFTKYLNDIKTRSAVERHLGIIGEAVNKYNKLDSNDLLLNTRQIIGLRNRIIHAYDSIDDNIIWITVKKHLPLLKEEVQLKIE